MKRILFVLSILYLLTSCSSLPKDKKDAGVRDKKEQAAAVLEHGNKEYLWDNHASSLNQYQSAFRLSASVDWQEGMIRSLIALSRSSDALGRGGASSVYLDRADFLLEEYDDPALALTAANRRTEWFLFNATADRALEESDKIISSADKAKGREAGEAWRIRAAILKRKGELATALEAADRALDLDEKRADLREAASDYYIRSSILSLSGDTEQAVQSMQKALALDKRIENTPAIAQDLYALGLIMEKAGDKERADHYFRRSALVYESAAIAAVPEGLSERLSESQENSLWKSGDDSQF